MAENHMAPKSVEPEPTKVGGAFIHAVCAKPNHQLVSVFQLVRERCITDEN